MTSLPHSQGVPPPRPATAVQRELRAVTSTSAQALRPSPLRRLLDIVVAGALLLLAAPVIGVAALLVRVLDGAPVMFRQQRLGEGGRPFGLLKLRTMRPGSAGPEVTATDDLRVTGVGRILRRTCVDELPQLWHVLRGQMTLVGPRPETVDLARRYPASCRQVLDVRPGLTGPTQLAYRERSAVPPPGWDVESWYLEVLVPLRTDADMEFLARPSLSRTVVYLLRTVAFVCGLRDYERHPTGQPPNQVRNTPCSTVESTSVGLAEDW
jgi:lipopolysaccharide/colanic/teichoic acid biosynthesis glycosyltransferase